jgi:hypothetical protein
MSWRSRRRVEEAGPKSIGMCPAGKSAQPPRPRPDRGRARPGGWVGATGGGARRRAQRLRGLVDRRRVDDRPAFDERVAVDPKLPTGPGAGRGAAGRAGPRDPCLRPGDDRRHGAPHGRRRLTLGGGNPVCLVAAAASRMCRIRQFRPQETCPVEHDLAGKCSCEQQRTRRWTCRRSGKGSHSQRGLS